MSIKTYFSLFSGIGGFELAMLQAIENLKTTQNIECVGFSEIDKYATAIYREHFPSHRNFGDITEIQEQQLPEFDLLVGGFPCQAFSIAGKRRGFNDTRGQMFFEVTRIIRQKQPRFLLLENVKGLLSHNQGYTFHTIIATLDELGYDLQWQVLNSKDFCVPQNRERVFIMGHLRGTPRPEIFPFTKSSDRDIQTQTKPPTKGEWVRRQIASTLASRDYKGGSNLIIEVGTWRTHREGHGFRAIGSCIAPTIPARARCDGSGQPVLKQNGRIRRLTPIECERLQGFPDDWTKSVSDTQRYKCLGNAVTVNVVQDILSRLINQIA